MTRKHFRAIAKILSIQYLLADTDKEKAAANALTEDFAYYLSTQNTNFDADKFNRAARGMAYEKGALQAFSLAKERG